MRTILSIFILVACYNFSFAQADSVYVQIVDDTVKILNVGVFENCCISVIISTAISNDSIIIVEHDTATSYCHCMCNFDFSVNLTNLAPGNYLVLVYRKYTFFTPDSLYFIDSTSFQYDVKVTGDLKSATYQSPCYTPVSVEEKPENYPMQTMLSQNYPNPFNPITTITYSLPVESEVRLAIFNVLGQIVTILANERQDSGNKSVKWESVKVPSGVYFYRLEAVGTQEPHRVFKQIRKMIVTK